MSKIKTSFAIGWWPKGSKFCDKQLKAKSEYKQAAIIMVRNIFKEAENKQCAIDGVVKSFYCLNKSVYGKSSKCVEQCLACALSKQQ